MNTVSQEYLNGIKEGRAFLKAWPFMNNGEQMTIQDMEGVRDTARRCLAQGFSREMADGFRGERDFWSGQIKKVSR